MFCSVADPENFDSDTDSTFHIDSKPDQILILIRILTVSNTVPISGSTKRQPKVMYFTASFILLFIFIGVNSFIFLLQTLTYGCQVPARSLGQSGKK